MDKSASDEDRARRRQEKVSEDLRTESTRMLSNGDDADAVAQLNGSVRPGSGSPDRDSGVESSCTADTPPTDSEVDHQPDVFHETERFSSHGDPSHSSYDDGRKSNSSMSHCQKNNSLHRDDYECGRDITTACPASAAKPHEDTDTKQSSTELKSIKLSNNDCQNSQTTNCCKMHPEIVELQTPHASDCISQSSNKPVADRDKVIVNGISDNTQVIDDIADDDDNDGVVFNTSDFEVLCAIKPEKELPSRLEELCEPVNCTDSLQWDVASLDLPDKAQMNHDKYRDSDAENLSLLGHMLYRNQIEPNNSLLFSSECRDGSQIFDAVNRHMNLTQRMSNNIQTRVFSDISDAEDDGATGKESIPNGTAENNRLLLSQSIHPTAVDEMENILNKSNMEIEEDIVRQIRSSFMDKENDSVLPRNSNGVSKLPTINYNVTHSLRGFKKSTWDVWRMGRRRRNKLGYKTISGVVDMLLKACDASEFSEQQMEIGIDAEECHNHNMEKVDEEVTLTGSSSELPGICGDEPCSPMDEAPPLLAITDLLKDGGNGTERIQTAERTVTANVGYDSDDTEAAMPVIEDMRSLLPAENEVYGNHEEGKGEAEVLSRARKPSKPRKRAIPAAGKEVMEMERTRSLSVVCDRCTFTCGFEQVLHRHVKVCHRASSYSNEQARYLCTECPATSDDRESFLDHLAHHPGQHLVRYYVCSHCGTDAVDMATMEKHISSSHDGTVLRFEVVQERISYLDNLMNCPLCDVASRWKKNIVGHLRNYHQMEKLAAYLEHGYRDQQCPEKLSIPRNDVMGQAGDASRQGEVSDSANNVSHYRDLCKTSSSFNSSMSVVVHICCRCTFSTDDINSYLEHYKGHFSTYKARPTTAAAAITSKSTDEQPTTVQHLVEQPQRTTGGSFVCHLCPFTTPKRMFYHRHMAIHERNTGMTDGYRCGYCQFAHPQLRCIKFHLGRYHGKMRTKVICISSGRESELADDGQDDDEDDETASRVPDRRSACTRNNGNQQVSNYDSLLNSSFSSTTTVPKSALPVNQKTREFANDRLRKLNEFERRLPPSMVYEEPLKCPLCNFTNNVRINLIRHLRSHRNDDEEEIGNSLADNDSGSAASESRTSDAGGYTQAAIEATAMMNMHDTGSKSVPTRSRLFQLLCENTSVRIVFSISVYKRKCIFIKPSS